MIDNKIKTKSTSRCWCKHYLLQGHQFSLQTSLFATRSLVLSTNLIICSKVVSSLFKPHYLLQGRQFSLQSSLFVTRSLVLSTNLIICFTSLVLSTNLIICYKVVSSLYNPHYLLQGYQFSLQTSLFVTRSLVFSTNLVICNKSNIVFHIICFCKNIWSITFLGDQSEVQPGMSAESTEEGMSKDDASDKTDSAGIYCIMKQIVQVYIV